MCKSNQKSNQKKAKSSDSDSSHDVLKTKFNAKEIIFTYWMFCF